MKTHLIPVCKNCKFWEPWSDYNGGCRRYPPTVLVEDGVKYSNIPQTDSSDWCGEFDWARDK
jgi:hypothetical protein